MIAPGLPETVLPIDQLRPDEEASVVELVGNGPEVHRLSEMGLRVGALVRMVRQGAPCLLALDGKRFSIRLSEDVDVLVAATVSA